MLRFLLDNDVDHAVATVLRAAGHDVVTASAVGLAGEEAAVDDEVTVYATDRDMIVVTHDREFTARRKRRTDGLHVRLMCAQPDAAEVLPARLEELLDKASWTETAVLEVYRTTVRHHPPRWD